MIRTLKDLKDTLSKIPDNDLEMFGIGFNFEGDGEVCIATQEESYELRDKYTDILLDVDNYLDNVLAGHERALDENDELEDVDDFITSAKKKE